MESSGRRLRACALAITASLAPAFLQAEAATDTAQVDITGSIPPTCTFTTLPGSMSLGALVSGAQTTLGAFGFTCNLAETGAVNVTVQSANGALKRDGGAETVEYEVSWNIQGNPAASGNAMMWVVPFEFTLLSGAAGAEQLGDYAVRIVGPTDGLIAGEYKDTITYTISP
jgi:hypothetical protein